MKENGALAIGVVQKLKKEYCVEIRLQRTAFLIPHTTCAINAWKNLRSLWTMSMAEVIKSIEREAFREAQSHETGGRNGEPIDCSTLEDEPVIVADNEADRQKFYECFYKQEPIEPNNKKCNLTFCQYNTDRECTNDKERKECIEASKEELRIKRCF